MVLGALGHVGSFDHVSRARWNQEGSSPDDEAVPQVLLSLGIPPAPLHCFMSFRTQIPLAVHPACSP